MHEGPYVQLLKRWMLAIGLQTDQAVEYMEWDKLYNIYPPL